MMKMPENATDQWESQGNVSNIFLSSQPGDEPIEKPCRHCGKTASGRIRNENGDVFCCHGCQGVFAILHAENLHHYYELMDSLGRKPGTQRSQKRREEFAAAPADILAQLFQGESENEYAVFVPSLVCAACEWVLKAALGKWPKVLHVEVNVPSRTLRLRLRAESGVEELRPILQQLSRIGYEPYPLDFRKTLEGENLASRDRIVRLGLAGFCFGNVMLYSAALYLSEWSEAMDLGYAQLFRWLSLALTLPALGYSAGPIFRTALASLRLRQLHIDLAVAVALVVGTVASLFNLLFGDSRHLYFDTVTGLIFVILASRALNESVLARARRYSVAVLQLLPQRSKWVKRGEIIGIARGEVLPADGRIVSTRTVELDESVLTGEFQPVIKKKGAKVFAGTENLGDPFQVEVTDLGELSVIGQMEKLMERARGEKTLIQGLSDKAARWFVALVFAVALGNAILCAWLGDGTSEIIATSTAVLVIGCPCAFAFGVPLVSALSLKRLWKLNAFAKSPHVFDAAKAVDSVILDKTGTLTTGEYSVRDFVEQGKMSARLQEALLVGLESSRHPVSRCLLAAVLSRQESGLAGGCDFFRDREWDGESVRLAPPSFLVSEIPGCGLEIVEEGSGNALLRVGKRMFCAEWGSLPSLPCSTVHEREYGDLTSEAFVISASGEYCSAYALSDTLRDGVFDFLRSCALRRAQVEILSGDQDSVIQSLVKKLCRDKQLRAQPELQLSGRGGCLPEDKLSRIEELQSAGRVLMMVGDGVNDTAALARAHLGVSACGSVDLAMKTADLTLLSRDLGVLKQVFALAVRCQVGQKAVLGVSGFYNVVALTLAAAGYVHPVVAAFLMPLSSLSVYLAAQWALAEGRGERLS